MSKLTVKMILRIGGVVFVRSDGQKFFLLDSSGGDVVLYRGEFTTDPLPFTSVANFDAATYDLAARAERRVRAYPNEPEDNE